MRKIIITLMIIVSALGMQAQKGEKTIGVSAGYNTYNENCIAGIFFQYRFSKYFRIAPDLQYQMKNNGVSGYQFNGNAHFPIKMDTRINFYPFAGVTYQSWRAKFNETDEQETRKNYFGANVGGGFEYFATPTLRLAAEAKYSVLRHYSSGSFTLSIGFVF